MGYTAIGDCRDPACNFLRLPVALQLPCVGTMTTTHAALCATFGEAAGSQWHLVFADGLVASISSADSSGSTSSAAPGPTVWRIGGHAVRAVLRVQAMHSIKVKWAPFYMDTVTFPSM